jgi:hypothetical protein
MSVVPDLTGIEEVPMSIRQRAIAAAVLVCCLAVARADAADGEWTVIPSACVPAPGSTGYFWQAAALALSAGNRVVVRCNVTDPADFGNVMDPVWNQIEVTYTDADGMANDSRVLVQLWAVGKGTGVSFLAGTFDSNSFAAAGGVSLNTSGFFHVFDFTNFGYFVQISLSRGSAAGDTRIFRVRLR